MVVFHLLDVLLYCCAFGALQLACIQDDSRLEMYYDSVQIESLFVSGALHQRKGDSLQRRRWYVVDSVVTSGRVAELLEFGWLYVSPA